ncbi:DciA family protein [Streptomyces anthocyanicus]|uniref:DciA family protein n=1 Tax=Streptomyces anthocyanicus TaxID=68174 RepID=UPI00380A7C81
MTTDELSGIDLARVALAAAKERAKQRGARSGPATRRRTGKRGNTNRTDGRDPMALGPALGRLMAERGWERPAAGGSVLHNWAKIAGEDGSELVHHVTAVRFDEPTGQLDLAADSTAWATQARLVGPQLMQRANQFLHASTQPGGSDGTEQNVPQVVRVITVKLQKTGVGAARPPHLPGPPPEPRQRPAEPPARAEPPEGYHKAKALLAAHKPDLGRDQAVEEAAERLTRSSRFREPDHVFADLIERHRPGPLRYSRGSSARAERTDALS